MKKYWDKLDVLEIDFIKFLMKHQKEYISRLEDILDSNKTLTIKTIERKLKRAREMNKQIYDDVKKRYINSYDKVFEDTIKELYKDENISGSFNKISWSRVSKLKQSGLVFMDNYTEDMIKNIKTQLYISYVNGESFEEAYERIKPYGNNSSRPKVMVRDQMSRISQEAIEEGYKAADNADKYYYYWTGPSDSRTTDICEDRKNKNPYTLEQMLKLDSHPHIQCRHRWTRRLRDK